MDYESLLKKENPFVGLDEEQLRKFLVYLCYVKDPVLSIEEVNKRWRISSEKLPPIFEANQLAAEIRSKMATVTEHNNDSADAVLTPSHSGSTSCMTSRKSKDGILPISERDTSSDQTAARIRCSISQRRNGPSCEEKSPGKFKWVAISAVFIFVVVICLISTWNDFWPTHEELAGMDIANRRNHNEQALTITLTIKEQARNLAAKIAAIAQDAELSGAKKYAADEWRKGVVARNHGDDNFNSGMYSSAIDYYSEAEDYFKSAQSVAKKSAIKYDAEQQKKQMIAASQEVEQSGSKKHAVGEWNKGVAAWNRGDKDFKLGVYDSARISYSEAEAYFKLVQSVSKKATNTFKHDAERQKKQMIAASQSAEEAGAKAHAVSEWNNGIAAWKLGDDMFNAKSYELAREHYSEAADHLKAAELTASTAKAKNLLASLPDLEVRAANLIKDNERWFKWSVDADALASMGNELCKEYKEVELLVSKGVLANFGDTKSKLGNLILRCYELAADAGNTMAMLKLAYWNENGKMCPKNGKKAVGWYVKAARAKNGDAMYRLGCFYLNGQMGFEVSGEKAYLMFRNAKANGCTFKDVNAWYASLPYRNPRGYKVFLWGGMNVELGINDLLDEIEAKVK